MKTASNPMQGKLPMHLSKRCKAKSKRSGEKCNNAAVTGWNVCRMHGAGGGAPKGKANGNYRHGFSSQESVDARRLLRDVIQATRGILDEL